MRFAGSPQITSFLAGSPKFGEMADIGLQARGHEQNMAHKSEALVAGAGLDAMAKVHSATHQARGIEAQGKAQGQIAQAQGMSGMMSGIAGGIGNISFGGGGGAAASSVSASPYAAPAQASFKNYFNSFG